MACVVKTIEIVRGIWNDIYQSDFSVFEQFRFRTVLI